MEITYNVQKKSKRLIHLERELSILGFKDTLKALDLVNKDMGQIKRHDGSPYVTHLYDVTLHLMNSGYKKEEHKDLLTASVLHDYAEDIDGISIKTIEMLFGENVAKIVDRVTKKQGVDYHKDLEEKERYFKNILECPDAIKLKVSDRICNFTTMAHSSAKHRLKQLNETKEWYLPLIKNARHIYVADEAYFYQAESIIKPLILEIEREFKLEAEKNEEIAELQAKIVELQNQLNTL